jgi:hypothetical protein
MYPMDIDAEGQVSSRLHRELRLLVRLTLNNISPPTAGGYCYKGLAMERRCLPRSKRPFRSKRQATRTGYTLAFSAIIVLQADLNTALSTTSLQRRQEVGDVVPWMPVETSTQPLLVEEVGNETDTSAEDEETVKNTHLEVVLSFLAGERTAVTDEVNEADSDAAINVENQVVLLRCCDGLDGQRIVEQLGAGEVLLDVLLDKLDAEIGVVTGLDPVANTGD